jgi:hypothetical protein
VVVDIVLFVLEEAVVDMVGLGVEESDVLVLIFMVVVELMMFVNEEVGELVLMSKVVVFGVVVDMEVVDTVLLEMG